MAGARHLAVRRMWLVVVVVALVASLCFLPQSAGGVGTGSNGKIVFASNRDTGDGRFQIYSMNPDGTGVTRLSDDAGSDRGPTWSPDGTKIAFASNRDYPNPAACDYLKPACPYDIYVMNANGSGQTRLASGGNNRHPSWSPDGQKILFSSNRNDPSGGNCDPYLGPPCDYDIFVMDSTGSG